MSQLESKVKECQTEITKLKSANSLGKRSRLGSQDAAVENVANSNEEIKTIKE